MKLKDYQKMAHSFAATDDPIEQVAYAVCDVFNLTVEQVDNMSKRKFIRYSNKINRVTKRIIKRAWYQKQIVLTDANKITLGQFIEIQHWVKSGEIDSLPLVAASILKIRTEHKADTEKMLNTDVRKILCDIKTFMQSFEELILSYSGLFDKDGMPPDATDEEIEEMEKAKALELHPFIEQYGWIFSAKQVAAFECITLEQAYGLPVIQAFNDLAYLKSEQDYTKQLNK